MIPGRKKVFTVLGYPDEDRGFDPNLYPAEFKRVLGNVTGGRARLDPTVPVNPYVQTFRKRLVHNRWEATITAVILVDQEIPDAMVNQVIAEAYKGSGAGRQVDARDLAQRLSLCATTSFSTRWGRACTTVTELPLVGGDTSPIIPRDRDTLFEPWAHTTVQNPNYMIGGPAPMPFPPQPAPPRPAPPPHAPSRPASHAPPPDTSPAQPPPDGTQGGFDWGLPILLGVSALVAAGMAMSYANKAAEAEFRGRETRRLPRGRA